MSPASRIPTATPPLVTSACLPLKEDLASSVLVCLQFWASMPGREADDGPRIRASDTHTETQPNHSMWARHLPGLLDGISRKYLAMSAWA